MSNGRSWFTVIHTSIDNCRQDVQWCPRTTCCDGRREQDIADCHILTTSAVLSKSCVVLWSCIIAICYICQTRVFLMLWFLRLQNFQAFPFILVFLQCFMFLTLVFFSSIIYWYFKINIFKRSVRFVYIALSLFINWKAPF